MRGGPLCLHSSPWQEVTPCLTLVDRSHVVSMHCMVRAVSCAAQVTASTSVLMILFTSSAIALAFFFQASRTACCPEHPPCLLCCRYVVNFEGREQ